MNIEGTTVRASYLTSKGNPASVSGRVIGFDADAGHIRIEIESPGYESIVAQVEVADLTYIVQIESAPMNAREADGRIRASQIKPGMSVRTNVGWWTVTNIGPDPRNPDCASQYRAVGKDDKGKRIVAALYENAGGYPVA